MYRHSKRIKTSRVVTRKALNIDLLLADIRNKLGLNWTFFAEGFEGAKEALVRKEDATVWLIQMSHLVQGRADLEFSHQGIMFLLKEAEVKVKTTSTHTIPPPLPFPDPTALLRSITPPPPPNPTMQSNSYCFNRPTPGLTYPFDASKLIKAIVEKPHLAGRVNAYLFHKHQTTIDSNNTDEPSSVLRTDTDPVFFQDDSFKREVLAFFGTPPRRSKASKHTTDSCPFQESPVSSYKADADDMAAWNSEANSCSENKGGENMGSKQGTDRWFEFWLQVDPFDAQK